MLAVLKLMYTRNMLKKRLVLEQFIHTHTHIHTYTHTHTNKHIDTETGCVNIVVSFNLSISCLLLQRKQ